MEASRCEEKETIFPSDEETKQEETSSWQSAENSFKVEPSNQE
jgi:hypothetical protein